MVITPTKIDLQPQDPGMRKKKQPGIAPVLIVLLNLLLPVIFLNPLPAHGLVASVDRETVPLNETVRLELRSNYSQDLDQIDLAPIRINFDIAGSSSQSEFSMVNGRTESVQKLTLTLAPTSLGQFEIPSLEHKGRKSNPIAIEVIPSVAPPGQLADQSIMVEAELDKNTALVNEQIIYTFRVIYRVELSAAEITKLTIAGAQAEPLPDANYQRTLNGQTYRVVEKRYALFFAEAGERTISGQEFSAVIGGSRNRFGLGFGLNSLAGGEQIKLGVEPIELEIKPVPETERGKPWLPAQSVELTENWNSTNNNAVVGQPLTRSIEIFAKGVSSEQLPAPAIGSSVDLNSYPEKPAFVSEPWHGGIAGKRIDTFALIPTRAGSFTLPEVNLHWWNTQAQRAEVARLPARTFNVAPAAAGAPASGSNIMPASDNASAIELATASTEIQQIAPSPAVTRSIWRIIALFALAGWLLSLLAGASWIARLKRERENSAMAAYDKDNTPEVSAATHRRKLLRACRDNDAQAARLYLDRWLRSYAREQALMSDTAAPLPASMHASDSSAGLLARLDDPGIQHASQQLDNHLFGTGAGNKTWNSDELRRAIETLKSPSTGASELPPLYPGSVSQA